MKRTVAAIALLAGIAAATPVVRREAIMAMESSFKNQLESSEMELLGLPRGIYIAGYGAVYTADVALCYTPTINPFRLTISKETVETIHQRKLHQLPVLRDDMKQMLLNSSASLDAVPMAEQIVLGVTLGHQNWEVLTGLPSQIVMQGQRSKLLDAKLGRSPVDSVIRVEEQ